MLRYGLAAVMIAASTAAFAHSGPYVGLQAGGSFLQSADNSGPGAVIHSTYNPGFGIALHVGRQFERHWRAEWELTYAHNNVDQLHVSQDTGAGVALFGQSLQGLTTNGGGGIDALSGMANVLFDFTPDAWVHPYIGAGIGASRISADISAYGVTIVNDATVCFTWQAIAGIDVDISRNASVYLAYHYLDAVNPSMTDEAGYQFDTAYRSQHVSIGVRYSFQ